MKRTITELENKLIEKGFRLSHKTYSGKHSQFVDEYVYIGLVRCFVEEKPYIITTKVYLDSKRNTIKEIDMINNFGNVVNDEILNLICNVYQQVKDYIYA